MLLASRSSASRRDRIPLAAVDVSWVKGETKDAKPGSFAHGDARGPVKKNEDQPQPPMLAAVVAAILPAVMPANLGLPAAGLEPGASSAGASNQAGATAGVELI